MTTSPCKDVTVGGCFMKEDNVIETVSLPISVELCQDICSHTTNCTVFRHNAEYCTLLREDYRQECHNAGGPPVNTPLLFYYLMLFELVLSNLKLGIYMFHRKIPLTHV